MLASPDRALAERQPLLPGLATALDPRVLADTVQSYGLDLPPDAEVGYIRFKPSTSCLVAYRPAGESGPPSFYATVYRRGSTKLSKSRARRVIYTTHGPGRTILSNESMSVCIFPNDDHLPVLLRLAHVKGREKLLSAMLAHRKSGLDSNLSILAYKPERRCVLKHTSPDGRVTVIRAYDKRGFGPALASASHFAHGASPGIQTLLGSDSRHRVLAMDWCDGKMLEGELTSGRATMSDVALTGTLLADLHCGEPDTLAVWNATTTKRRVNEILRAFHVLCPDLVPRATALAGRVSRAAAAIIPGRATLHGDFNARQVIVGGGAASFIDFDEAASGPPAIDLGGFIAHLGLAVLRRDITHFDSARAIDAFLGGYESRTSLPSRNDIRAATALAFFALAHEPFRRHRSGWPDEISSILDLTEQQLGVDG